MSDSLASAEGEEVLAGNESPDDLCMGNVAPCGPDRCDGLKQSLRCRAFFLFFFFFFCNGEQPNLTDTPFRIPPPLQTRRCRRFPSEPDTARTIPRNQPPTATSPPRPSAERHKRCTNQNLKTRRNTELGVNCLDNPGSRSTAGIRSSRVPGSPTGFPTDVTGICLNTQVAQTMFPCR